MDIYALIIISMFVGYLIGSIPFALIVGKIFYKTDVRKHGSKNLGSANVGRTLLLPRWVGNSVNNAREIGGFSSDCCCFFLG